MTEENTDTSVADVVETLRKNTLVMLTTAEDEGKLVSHPMTIQRVDDDATTWYFIGKDSEQAQALKEGSNVNVAVSELGTWLSVAGAVTYVDDADKVAQLWDSSVEAYFPEGPSDPNVALFRIDADSAQSWGQSGGRIGALLKIVAAKVTGTKAGGGTSTTEL